jgi:hypothetical protein
VKIPVHEALRQVRELKQAILDKQRFKGYSGRARALAGGVALAAGIVLHSTCVPADPSAHLAAWAVVFVVSLFLNYGALVYWFLNDADVARDFRRLAPALEIVPAVFAGGVVTLALVHREEYDLLFGVWMLIYGLINFTARPVLPRGLAWVGLYYLVCGAACLLALPALSFTKDPLVMGGVFFAGEFFGGLILHNDENSLPSVRAFFGLPAGARPENEDAGL